MAETRNASKLFETRSQAWREVGLLRQITPASVRRARIEMVLLVPLFVGVVIVYEHRRSLLGVDVPVRIAAVVALLALGWAMARDIGRALGPPLFRRLEPATAGTVGFLIRLVTVAAALLIALRVAGLSPETLAVSGAFAVVIFGLAAQQTLGNLIAGTVLLSARPFRVGDRVRLRGGAVGGQVEGVVSSLGLLYTTFATGEDSLMVPNSVVLGVAVMPLHEPEAVELRARLRPGVTPGELQELLESSLEIPLRGSPRITLEELDGEEVVVRIAATPERAADGRQLAGELLSVVSRQTPGGRRVRGASGGPQGRIDRQAERRAERPAERQAGKPAERLAEGRAEVAGEREDGSPLELLAEHPVAEK